MSGIFGWIQGYTDVPAWAEIICRNEDIDSMLRESGIDPNTINVVESPLIGAANWLTAKVLIQPDQTLATMWRTQGLGENDSVDPWELYLVEPLGVAAGSDVIDPAQIAFLPTPEIKTITNVAIPLPEERDVGRPDESLVSQVQELVPPNSGLSSQTTQTQPVDRKPVDTDQVSLYAKQRAISQPQQLQKLQHLEGPGRNMLYTGLIISKIIELRRPASAIASVAVHGGLEMPNHHCSLLSS